jgi:hypothetical protein
VLVPRSDEGVEARVSRPVSLQPRLAPGAACLVLVLDAGLTEIMYTRKAEAETMSGMRQQAEPLVEPEEMSGRQLHVVLGTGPLGLAVVRHLATRVTAYER